jgi:hypothetical protein
VQVLTPTDVEQAVIDELGGAVGTSLPGAMPDEFVRVVAAGGFERDLVADQPLVTIEGFARREQRARALTSSAVARLAAAVRQNHSVGGVPAYRLSVGALPQNLPLASVPTHLRYIATIALDLRRSVSNL